ncbi:MAG TPA: hypothetical protein VFT50_05950 [Baekduia sp.]|nr:hypothetical protein [Baekduia sp.]
MPRRRSRLAGVGLAAALAAAAPATAQANRAGSITKSAGDVTATVSWTAAHFGIADPQLVVRRAGATYDVTIQDVCGEGCIIVPDDRHTDAGHSMLKVADLDADGEPEVLVDTFSGGAHCCLTARLLTWTGSGYQPHDIAYGDVGYELRDADGDGRPELVGYDPRFSAAFTYYAASAFPAQVLQVDHGETVDVTRRFPKVVAADARRWRKELRRAGRHTDIRGLLSAYVADLYTLRRGTAALRVLHHDVARHRVGARYRQRLLRKLHAWGYR